jgi:hypothetical protein
MRWDCCRSPCRRDGLANAAVLAARVQSACARAWRRSRAWCAGSRARRAERHDRGPAGRAGSHRDHIYPSAAEVRPADRQCHPEDPGNDNRSAPAEEWNAALLRHLWPALNEQTMGRKLSVEHEEAWLTSAGFLLRPGFGFAHDGLRMDELWQLRDAGLCFPANAARFRNISFGVGWPAV